MSKPPDVAHPAVPVLESNRLRLRGHRASDYGDCCAMWADPAVVRFIGGKPSTPQQTWSRLLTYLGLWHALGYGYWAIEEKDGGSFIGEIGFADFKRDIDPAMQGVPEIGFALVGSAHGKGYASEAVEAVLQWGDSHLPSQRTVALVNRDNAASLRILQKAAYVEFGGATFNGAEVRFFERNR